MCKGVLPSLSFQDQKRSNTLSLVHADESSELYALFRYLVLEQNVKYRVLLLRLHPTERKHLVHQRLSFFETLILIFRKEQLLNVTPCFYLHQMFGLILVTLIWCPDTRWMVLHWRLSSTLTPNFELLQQHCTTLIDVDSSALVLPGAPSVLRNLAFLRDFLKSGTIS